MRNSASKAPTLVSLASERRGQIHIAAGIFLACASTASNADQTEPSLDMVEVRSAAGRTPLQELPASASVVDGEQIQDRQLQVNLSEGLGGVPGLQLRNRQNYAQDLQLSVRGFGARSAFGIRGIRLYVDGIPATMPDGQGSLSHLDISSLERIEVIRGPYSALYGNSSGGVISAYTQTPEGPPAFEGGYSVGSNGQKRLSSKASGKTDSGISYLLSTSRYRSDGFREHSAADRNIFNAKISTSLGEAANLSIVANSISGDAQDPQGLTLKQWQSDPHRASYRADTGEAVASKFNTRKSLDQTQVGLTYERHLNDSHTLSITAYGGQRQMSQYQSIPVATQLLAGHPGGVIKMSRIYGGLNARWTARFSEAPVPVTVIAGLAIDSMKEERQGYDNYQDKQLGIEGRQRRNERSDVINIDPYLQASWQLSPHWSLETGLRYSKVQFKSVDRLISAGNPDDSGESTYKKALPVASLSYRADEKSTLYASVGRGFETPTLTELSYRPNGASGMNFDIMPSVSTQYEVGWRKRFAGTVAGGYSAALFQANTSDEIVNAGSENGRTSYRNAGKTLRRGIELQSDLYIGRRWKLRAAYTYLDASFRTDLSPNTQGKQLAGLSKHRLSTALDYQIAPNWQAGITAEHSSKTYVNDANSEFAPGFSIAGLSLGWSKTAGPWSVKAFARIDNLFDRKHVGSVIVNDANARYYEGAPGRTWVAGMKISYGL